MRIIHLIDLLFDAHNDQFDFSPSPSQSGKNLKNLKLELNHDNLSDTSSLPDVNQNQKFESSNNPYQSRNSSSDGPVKDIYAQQGYQTQSQPNSQPGSANSGVRFDPRRQRHQPASATSSKFPAQNSLNIQWYTHNKGDQLLIQRVQWARLVMALNILRHHHHNNNNVICHPQVDTHNNALFLL